MLLLLSYLSLLALVVRIGVVIMFHVIYVVALSIFCLF